MVAVLDLLLNLHNVLTCTVLNVQTLKCTNHSNYKNYIDQDIMNLVTRSILLFVKNVIQCR